MDRCFAVYRYLQVVHFLAFGKDAASLEDVRDVETSFHPSVLRTASLDNFHIELPPSNAFPSSLQFTHIFRVESSDAQASSRWISARFHGPTWPCPRASI